jgi:hypothetical protein
MYIRTLHSKLLYSFRSTCVGLKVPPICLPIAAIRMASSQHGKRRFAPLGQSATDGTPALQGIVFDMDGTLCMSKQTPSVFETHMCSIACLGLNNEYYHLHPSLAHILSTNISQNLMNQSLRRRTPKLHVRRNARRARYRQRHRHPGPHLLALAQRARNRPRQNPSHRTQSHGAASPASRPRHADGVFRQVWCEEGVLYAEFRVSLACIGARMDSNGEMLHVHVLTMIKAHP